MNKYINFSLLPVLIVLFVYYFFITGDKKVESNQISSQTHWLNTDTVLERHYDSLITPKIDAWFKKLYKNSRFNGNILVAQNGIILYENSYGYADYKRKDTLTLRHRFQIGSVSKQFTAMAVMILHERGLLDYSDSIQKFFPDFPYKGITVYQLLTHRSGLPNYNYFCDFYTDRETTVYNSDVLHLMIDSVPAVYYPPNHGFHYCNTNYALLAAIVEQVSAMPFELFANKEIFNKAGMWNTTIFVKDKHDRIYKSAKGYHYKWLEALHTYQDGVTGDKGVYTTVEDLLRWDKALYENKLIADSSLQKAFEFPQVRKNSIHAYGFGWRLRKCIDGSKIIYHGGWWRGFNALFVRDIKNKVTIVILSNIRTRSFSNSYQELLGIFDTKRLHERMLFEEKMAELKKQKGDSSQVIRLDTKE
ncbi:MAG: beta-lactamase family protein [Bacteroidales bacterium]|nr:beta-lactamase family protein [Bacteroidales bacterium]